MSASAARHLRVVDGNGELVEPSGPEEQVRALQQALVRAQRTIDQLKADKRSERQKARETYPIDHVFNDWQTKLVSAGLKGKARCKLSEDRIDAIHAMFVAEYTLADFELVNTGIATHQYVRYGRRELTGTPKDHEVDLGYVCKEARRFEEACRLGYIAEKARAKQVEPVESVAHTERPGDASTSRGMAPRSEP